MDNKAILLAKIAALHKNLTTLDWGGSNSIPSFRIEHLIIQFENLRNELVEQMPELYKDLPMINIPQKITNNNNYSYFNNVSILNVIQSLEYILEVHANYRIGERQLLNESSNRIFLSHGTSREWLKVQLYLEKTLGVFTLELEQEANLGRTILQKLNDESSRCGYAVIVMTGDDVFEDEIRARENVLHEIGFFQGKYGLQNIILLHEVDVNIPSNIHGLVYISFPKDAVESAFGALTREIKTILK